MRACSTFWAGCGALLGIAAGCGNNPPPAAYQTPMRGQSSKVLAAPAERPEPPAPKPVLNLAGRWIDASGAEYNIDSSGAWDTIIKFGKVDAHISGTLKIEQKTSTLTTTKVEVTSEDPTLQDQLSGLQQSAEQTYLLDQPQTGQAVSRSPDEIVVTAGTGRNFRSLDLKRDNREQTPND